MPVYTKNIIKDNYVQELNPLIASFTGFEWGRQADLSSMVDHKSVSEKGA